jgi:uncharacterized protein
MLDLATARQWYPGSDAVHGFDHVERVYRMAERLAQAEGADLEIVQAAALLHDAVGADPNGEASRADHQHASAEFARRVLEGLGWSAERIAAVQHCIRAHRYRSSEPPHTLEARVLFDADKLDVLGAIGAARTVAYAAQAGQPIYAEPSRRFLETGEKEPGEPHSSYHEYLFKLSKVKARLYTPTARAIADQRHAFLVAFYDQLAGEARNER